MEQITNCIDKIHEEAEFKTLLEFFETGFRLTEDDRFKDFRLELSPWIRTLCEWAQDSKVDWIFLIQGSQTSKTTFMMGFLLFVSQYVKGAIPVTWAQSTEEESKLFVTERLRAFLDESGKEAIKKRKWKQTAFRVYNAAVKIAYASTKVTLRSKPARFIIGDECSLWKITVEYFKKRTRTFQGKRKGIFGTTPPEDPEHHSWTSATAGNVYQWWVPCPFCGEYQGLKFARLKWSGRDPGTNEWNHDIVFKTARYHCEHCNQAWEEKHKLEILDRGKAVCVDPETWEKKAEKRTDTKTLQVSALYSVFTPWGQLACDFLTAKASGWQALRVFFTDELAIPCEEQGESFQENELSKYIDSSRPMGVNPGYELYTAGVDVQRLGDLYFVIMGWKSGPLLSGHILEYGITTWVNEYGAPDWNHFLEMMGKYQRFIRTCTLDSSDGVVTQDVYDFVNFAGPPFVALKDTATALLKTQYKQILIDPKTKKPIKVDNSDLPGQPLLVINSNLVKNDLAAAFKRTPEDLGAWSFPAETSKEFLTHMTNEHKILEKKSGKTVITWKPKFSHAPQHWFSAAVYATAAMEEFRVLLQKTRVERAARGSRVRRFRSRGVEL